MLNDTQLAIARQILNLGGKLDTKFSTMFIEEVESLQQQNKQKDELLEKCLVGGNSLASLVVAYELPKDHHEWSYEDASSYFYKRYPLDPDFAYQRYEIWLCWKTLMDVSSALQSIQGGTDNANS